MLLDLFVGCLPQEHIRSQPIEIDFYLFFASPPQGCVSDCLADTVCYARCVELIEQTAKKKHFQLIEHLGFAIHAALIGELPRDISVRVRVKKLQPPISNVTKGVCFTYG